MKANLKQNSKRVLHILGSLNPSGMERMLVSSAKYYGTAGFRSYVLGQGAHHPYADTLKRAGYEVVLSKHNLRTHRGRRFLNEFIKKENIGVIHVHTESNYLVTVLTVFWALGFHGRVIRTIHNVFAPRGIKFIFRLLQALIADRFVSSLVAPSSDVARNEKRFLRKPKVIYNWVDDKFFDIRDKRNTLTIEKHSDSKIRALIVGNCSQIKRHELAEYAVLEAGHALFHVGSEENISNEERLLLGVFETQDLLLTRGSQPPDFAILNSDYFVMPSTNEGMPVALAEALVVGLPCYISDSPGLRWAKHLPQVFILPGIQSVWNEKISAHANLPKTNSDVQLPIDFSARRGATEYMSLYERNGE